MTESVEGRGGLRGALLRFLLMVAILAAAFFLFRDSELSEMLAFERLSATVDRIRTLWWSPLALILLWIVMSPLGLPASPLVAGSAVVFGIWWGTLYSSIGAMLGATATYFFVRLLGRDLVTHLLGSDRVARVEQRLEQYGFRALVGIRFLPLPWPLVNFAAALAGFRFGPFFIATLLGAVPIIFIFTLFFSSLAGATLEASRTRLVQFLIAIGVLALLVVLRIVARRRTQGLDEAVESDGDAAVEPPD